jgi:sigma-B regulation protein RsbU (phosphoserine phosphatase)
MFSQFLNPSGPIDTPNVREYYMVIEEADEVQRLACLELRGGNHLAAYSAELPGLAGWVSCHPLRPSPRGGDLYYLSACRQGAVARIVLADVAGHGEIVSSAAVRLHDALLQHIDEWDQSTLIRQLNDNVLKGAQGARFATAFLGSFYSDSGELLFTNAGHLPPLWYRAGAREWSFLYDSTPLRKEIVDLPLGLIAGTSYTQTAVQLELGDLLLLYTDGISESYDESGAQLGLDRLLSIARNLPTESAVAAGKALLAAVASFRGTAPAADDETVVALQRRTSRM